MYGRTRCPSISRMKCVIYQMQKYKKSAKVCVFVCVEKKGKLDEGKKNRKKIEAKQKCASINY